MGGKLSRVKTVARGRVEAVAIGSNCWASCKGLYKLGCHSSLALVNEEGKASGAFTDGACTGGACRDRACAGGACTDKAVVDRACTGGAYADGA